MTKLSSWGRYFEYDHQKVLTPNWQDEVKFETGSRHLCYGLGRSYGDSCLVDGGISIQTSRLNRFIKFDPILRLLTCEAGVSFANIISEFLPRGFFLPVTPGTKFITVGGAIANDVHGKNHHQCGTFGRFVKRIALLRSNGQISICTPIENAGMFNATIGGLGLTGMILWAEFELMRVENPLIDEEVTRFNSLNEFFEIESEISRRYSYTVAWIDCLARGPRLGRGIFIAGAHSNSKSDPWKRESLDPKIRVPIEPPNWSLNRWSIKAFNQVYFHKSPSIPTKTRKSTLVKCIMKEIKYEGNLQLGHNTLIGYFAQNEASQLDEQLTVFQTIDDSSALERKGHCRCLKDVASVEAH